MMNKKQKWFTSLSGQSFDSIVLDSYINRGKTAFVYMGYKKEMPNWNLAIKLTPGIPDDGREIEIRKAQQLRGITGVVPFHDAARSKISFEGIEREFLYTVWDYISPGRNLQQYLKEIKKCKTSFLVAVVERILRILHACENSGAKRHGDLHAKNILIGNENEADLDSNLNPRDPIYVSDFGYGHTDGTKQPKEDYEGLSQIVNLIIRHIDWDNTGPTDRQIIFSIRNLMSKLLKETARSERIPPREILRTLLSNIQKIRSTTGFQSSGIATDEDNSKDAFGKNMTVGQFPVAEMLGDDWEKWKKLFVSSVPAKSRILEQGTHVVITGPRGCGKTMLLRRLSERLVIECGPVKDNASTENFVGFYINSNDVADAFSSFQRLSNIKTSERLICYANLSLLSDILTVQSARCAKLQEEPTNELLDNLKKWLLRDKSKTLVTGENALEHYRSVLDQIKDQFPKVKNGPYFPAYMDFARHTWLPRLISLAKRFCPWMDGRGVFIFIDDYTTPRISEPMQNILNRLFFQRSAEFVCKIATESATTFIPTDSSGKFLQDGDDFFLIDMGEEALFMQDAEKEKFLNEIFQRRLAQDQRIPKGSRNLEGLLGHLGKGKLEFARLLRQDRDDEIATIDEPVSSTSKRRGATKLKTAYHGYEVFINLWSGDTRTMVQLVHELVDAASLNNRLLCPIDKEIQDRVFKTAGGQWLEAQTRNAPTNREAFERALMVMRKIDSTFELTGGSFGTHLKAIIGAFVKAAKQLLMSPMYKIQKGKSIREVPRMAFRIEIINDLRLSDLSNEIYKDLIRYGMFMRDSRGKSVRGAFVPRLYLRRLLLPSAKLALSKRDSLQLSCNWFEKLLLTPDIFSDEFTRYAKSALSRISVQRSLFPLDEGVQFKESSDSRYNDIEH